MPDVVGQLLTVGGTAVSLAGHAHLVRRVFGWYIAGTPSIANNQGPNPIADGALTLTGIRLYAKIAPSGGTFEVDVQRWDGSAWASIFSTRPTIASGQNLGGSAAVLSITSLSLNDVLRLDVIGVSGAADVSVQLFSHINVT